MGMEDVVIGRDAEQAQLLEALESPRSELIVVYGRRRIGKTYLIRNTYAPVMQFEFAGMHRGSYKDQLKGFHKALQKKWRKVPAPADWIEAFDLLGRYLDGLRIKRKPGSAKARVVKKVIFIDEFPWLDTRRSGFLPAFSDFWNSYATKRKDLVVVICGSAASYMVTEVIKSKGGLHNRLTRRIRLAPFNLRDTEQLLQRNRVRLTRYDIVQLYMALGGVPYYLQQVKPGESAAQAIDRLCFEPNGFLRDEFGQVFASLFDRSENHTSIVRTLADVRRGLTRNEVLRRSKVRTGGTLTNTLQELEQSGFIDRYTPYKGSKDPLFRLTDEYSLFYLKFIEDTKPARRGLWMKLGQQPKYKAWAGFTFETICMKHVEQIKEALRISGIRSVEGSWNGKGKGDGAQIDLLIDRDDNVINLCEMKFAGGPFSIDKKYASELMKKAETFRSATRTRKSIFITLITTHGLAHNAYSRQLVQNELTMEALFAIL
jgi:uncharacterized protein